MPTFLTSISTMIGFFSLVSTELIPVQNLGVLMDLVHFITGFNNLFLCPRFEIHSGKKL